jgi:hypothetical protein
MDLAQGDQGYDNAVLAINNLHSFSADLLTFELAI